MKSEEYIQKLFEIDTESDFNDLSIAAFHFQYKHIAIYRQFVDSRKILPQKIAHFSQIPFLPISFFKTHALIAEKEKTQKIFKSSGTTDSSRCQHFVQNLSLYEQAFFLGFENIYGSVSNYCILALLPSYIENGDSSLVYMAEKLIQKSKHKESGFYLNNLNELINKLEDLENRNQKTILLGVSYALLDVIEKKQFQLKNTIIMETGGMKGRRKEMIREELHQKLSLGFGTDKIHSEYGMTELLSQTYSTGNGIFENPPWMKILIRDVNDPTAFLPIGQSGGINVIDLSNLYSISFIETKDLGKILPTGQFEILGRFDNSDVRGCNLLIV